MVHGGQLTGEAAFLLYDTFGFPLELTMELLEKESITVDLEGFETEMKKQRERARAASAMGGELFDGNATILGKLLKEHGPTKFLGYETLEGSAAVLALIKGSESTNTLETGEEAYVLLNQTPCYAESGGQVSDLATMQKEGVHLTVQDIRKGVDHLILHHVRVEEGTLKVGDKVAVTVDEKNRRAIRANHTATHLLHAALRRQLGDHVQQAGSYVGPDKLRFDFSHPKGLSADQLIALENEVNEGIAKHEAVNTYVESIDEAKKRGAMMIFGEKYGDVVRVLDIPGMSMEFCGGTHVSNTDEIGVFAFTEESSIGSGIRRVEAVTGEAAKTMLLQRSRALKTLELDMKATPEEIPERVKAMREEKKSLMKELKRLLPLEVRSAVEKARADAPDNALVVLSYKDRDPGSLKDMAGAVHQVNSPTVLALISDIEGTTHLVVATNKAAQSAGHSAGELLGKVKDLFGGKGGGAPAYAQTGAKDVDPKTLANQLKAAFP
jgi:alanyl-tRNA synthetase